MDNTVIHQAIKWALEKHKSGCVGCRKYKPNHKCTSETCGMEYKRIADWLEKLAAYEDKTYITSEFLIRNGFTKRANDYLYNNDDVEITAKLLFAENNCWYVYIGFTDHSDDCESLLIYTVGQLRMFLAIEGLNNIKI